MAGFAVTGTFHGLLIANSFDPPIPIVVDLRESFGIFSGRVKTSSPLVGDGPIVSGAKEGSTCHFTSHIGGGVNMRLEGKCLSTSLDGKYRIYFPDGRRLSGTFKLNVLKPDNEKLGPLAEGKRNVPSPDMTAACLKTNSACLAVCPRGVYEEEFICVNGCRRRLTNCKGKAKRSLEPSSATAY
jgi:hypothetical protein